MTVEFCGGEGEVVATVKLDERTMFWSDGVFARGPAYAPHAGFFGDLEAASRRFQAASGDAEQPALAELAEIWTELNHHFRARERGSSVWLVDVGLLLDGERASVRYYAPEGPETLSDAQLDELERAMETAPPDEQLAAARRYLPRLIAEVRRARG
ncbi:hypothetical protein DVA67_022240 [Solirubrobacter sp. CPCC 204708]|uniref:NUDIX hydrolase n=1 Tax=Solirubrobacter deserti TaxID=2282478 RepID=A0ABT4RRU5_9ACTN|nr:hypothetical protein [Solirubrobacter deserti]MDA0141304.1 hypothetical protein [Solirubrobacter deserti]